MEEDIATGHKRPDLAGRLVGDGVGHRRQQGELGTRHAPGSERVLPSHGCAGRSRAGGRGRYRQGCENKGALGLSPGARERTRSGHRAVLQARRPMEHRQPRRRRNGMIDPAVRMPQPGASSRAGEAKVSCAPQTSGYRSAWVVSWSASCWRINSAIGGPIRQ